MEVVPTSRKAFHKRTWLAVRTGLPRLSSRGLNCADGSKAITAYENSIRLARYIGCYPLIQLRWRHFRKWHRCHPGAHRHFKALGAEIIDCLCIRLFGEPSRMNQRHPMRSQQAKRLCASVHHSLQRYLSRASSRDDSLSVFNRISPSRCFNWS